MLFTLDTSVPPTLDNDDLLVSCEPLLHRHFEEHLPSKRPANGDKLFSLINNTSQAFFQSVKLLFMSSITQMELVH
jgi:hypothetical protein